MFNIFCYFRIDENSAKESKQSIFLMEENEDEEDINDRELKSDRASGSRSCSCSPHRESLPETNITQVKF